MSEESKSGNPRFFCESCNAEVPLDAKICPKCGKNFASVRCPFCDFIGEAEEFRGGCPTCGHVLTGIPGSDSSPSPKKKKKPRSNFRKEKKPPGATGSLPLWVYILTTAALTATLAALFFTVF